jgi:methionyl aminopeptidase
MIKIKKQHEIEKMRDAGRIIGLLWQEMEKIIAPGISTWDLDKFADEFIRSHGAYPAFKGYTVPGLAPFPGAICASVNSVIVHGIPAKNVILKEGDIIGVDVGTRKAGYHGDSAYTFTVGQISKEAQDLLDVTKKALEIGINAAIVGNRVGDISYAIGKFVKDSGYYCADDLTGHGIGKELHEDPMIPNVGRKGTGKLIKEGMTIAIEPMVNIGTNKVIERGWEYLVKDGSLSAHFEHTILVTDTKPEILTKVGRENG